TSQDRCRELVITHTGANAAIVQFHHREVVAQLDGAKSAFLNSAVLFKVLEGVFQDRHSCLPGRSDERPTSSAGFTALISSLVRVRLSGRCATAVSAVAHGLPSGCTRIY